MTAMKTLRREADARGVVRLTLSRPEVLNAFDEAMIDELATCFTEIAADTSARVVVLQGDGKLFSAGADIGWMQRQSQAGFDDNLADARRFAEMLRLLHECPQPTVVRVHGHAFGGGVGLMAAADIVVAVPQARFAISEAKFGILPSVIGPYVTQAMGARHARRLALTAARFDAGEAQRLGLIHEVVAPEALDATIDRIIGEVLANGPQALAEIKAMFGWLHGRNIDDAVREHSAQTIARVRGTSEAREGFSAFLAKRPPAWQA